jgi:hypothetical protein
MNFEQEIRIFYGKEAVGVFFLFKRRDKVNGCFWGGKKEEYYTAV